MTGSTAPLPLHVLMTRFNLATPGREAAIRNRPDWLAERFALFERYCLPSVAAQKSGAQKSGAQKSGDQKSGDQQPGGGPTAPFTWIIYFDEDTPQEFRDRIRALQREVPFEAYYTGLFPASGWPRSLVEVLGPLPPLVLTSRLDNDDALAADYMARTRAAAADPSAAALAAPRLGIVLTHGFIRSGPRAYAVTHPCNAFTSWLERTGDPAELYTAMGIRHMEADQFGPLRQVDGPGGWLQVVHGGNVSNRVRGRRVAPAALEGRFQPGALDGLDPVRPVQLLLENTLVAPLRAARDRAAIAAARLRRPV